MDHFVAFDEIGEVLSRGSTRSSVILKCGIQVDLRVVPEESFGAAMHYFTGSRSHNIAIRRIGQNMGLKINEYGVFKKGRRIAGQTEQSVYESVGLPFIPPELRENRGEIEAAKAGLLPELVELSDLRGDLHVHCPHQGYGWLQLHGGNGHGGHKTGVDVSGYHRAFPPPYCCPWPEFQQTVATNGGD
jgi:DNA polymerase (family 10)